MISEERRSELDFLIRTKSPITVLAGTPAEKKALKNAKDKKYPYYQIDEPPFLKWQREKGFDGVFDDFFTISELIYCGVLSIIDLSIDSPYVLLCCNQDVKLYNGNKVFDLEKKQKVNVPVDYETLKELANYYYNGIYYV